MVFELLYTSVLAPGADVRSVADIIRRSRSYNRLNSITGILVFDGRRFCQHIEGDREEVLLLADRIKADPRHQQFNVLYQCFVDAERRFGEWSMAYAQDSQGTLIEILMSAHGPKAADLLQQYLSQLEFQPP